MADDSAKVEESGKDISKFVIPAISALCGIIFECILGRMIDELMANYSHFAILLALLSVASILVGLLINFISSNKSIIKRAVIVLLLLFGFTSALTSGKMIYGETKYAKIADKTISKEFAEIEIEGLCKRDSTSFFVEISGAYKGEIWMELSKVRNTVPEKIEIPSMVDADIVASTFYFVKNGRYEINSGLIENDRIIIRLKNGVGFSGKCRILVLQK